LGECCVVGGILPELLLEIAVALLIAYLILIPEGIFCAVLYYAGANAFNKGEGLAQRISDTIKADDSEKARALCKESKGSEEGFCGTLLRMLDAETSEESYEEMVLFQGRVKKSLKKHPIRNSSGVYTLIHTLILAGPMYLVGPVPWAQALIGFAWLIGVGMFAPSALIVWGSRNRMREFSKSMPKLQEAIVELKRRNTV